MRATPPGAYDGILHVNGIRIDVTYDLDGRHYPATETSPEEFPDRILRTAHIGTENITSLADLIHLDDRLQELRT